jgi:MoaA/NifB/PqqE/SkfB family radical SAM enzyme
MNEIESLAMSLPTLRTLMLSGGEPFVRKDLVDICRAFIKHCKICTLVIPTSGTLIETTVKTVEDILNIDPSFRLVIGISMDGMEEYHDSNRGVPGTFSKAVECCAKLIDLKKKYKNLVVNILTTLVHDNKEELLALKKMLAVKLPGIDVLCWGIARGEIKDGNLGVVSTDDVDCIDREFLEFNFHGRRASLLAIISKFYEFRREAFVKNIQPIPCVAGKRIAVVYDDGGVAPCELLPQVGNIRDASFEMIWQSDQMNEAREKIASGKCACTHECFLAPSYYDAFLPERPLAAIKLGGIDGLFRIVYEKCRFDLMTRFARKFMGRLNRGH